jgi:hypothetical protein
MAKKAKSLRLKVYKTQIGLHDWLVAAPSQKAALKAWDIRKNLFAIGSASVVTDKGSIELAMKTPGEPVAIDANRSRSRLSQVVSLDEHRRRKTGHHPAKKPIPKPPKPRKADRSKLDRAEDTLEEFHKRAIRERAALLRARKALDLKAEDLEADLEAEQDRLEKALENAREKYEANAGR